MQFQLSHFQNQDEGTGAGHDGCTCQMDAGPTGQTASELGRCTCCSSSQSPVPAAQLSDCRHADVSHSQRFSSPAEQNRRNILGLQWQNLEGFYCRGVRVVRFTLKRCFGVRKPVVVESCS